jgi:hypothetical protein
MPAPQIALNCHSRPPRVGESIVFLHCDISVSRFNPSVRDFKHSITPAEVPAAGAVIARRLPAGEQVIDQSAQIERRGETVAVKIRACPRTSGIVNVRAARKQDIDEFT